MRRGVAAPASLVVCTAAALFACRDAARPQLFVGLSVSSRLVSVHEDSVVVRPDSATLTISGADSASWTAVHGGGSWLTISTPSGLGSGVVRWVRDARLLNGGTYVDTITVAVQGVGSGRIVDTLLVREAPAQLVAVRRAWLPGERGDQVAAIVQSAAWGPYSSLAEAALDPDSATVIAGNPLYPATRLADLASALQTPGTAGWQSQGIDLYQVDATNPSPVATDTLNWLMVFYWNTAEPTWKGFTVAHSTAETVSRTALNTAAFDASYGTSGAGGGEARQTTGEYWEASGGDMQISWVLPYGAASPIDTGQWAGGTIANGTMHGRLRRVLMPRVDPSPQPGVEWSYDFRGTGVPSFKITCLWRNPGPACQATAALRRGVRAALLR